MEVDIKHPKQTLETSIIALDTAEEVWKLLTEHPTLKEWFKFLDTYYNEKVSLGFLLPCASSKLPSYTESKSPYYKFMYKILKPFNCPEIQVFTISEPLGIHPSNWKWVSEKEWLESGNKVGILPYYNVTGLFGKKDEYFYKCVKFLGVIINKFLFKHKDCKFNVFVKLNKSHMFMIQYALGLRGGYYDIEIRNVKVFVDKMKELKGMSKGFHFIRPYEKEIVDMCSATLLKTHLLETMSFTHW